MNRTETAVEPEISGATAYAVGVDCTWHDFAAAAAQRVRMVAGERTIVPVCPICAGEVSVTTIAALGLALNRSEWTPMLTWSRGRCYPDADTLLNAYRQATVE